MNIEKLYIISALNKEIVSIYVINDTHDLHMLSITKDRSKSNCFLPSRFLLFHDNYFLIQFVDIKTKNIYLKMFRFVISHKNNFVEILNAAKKQIKNDDFIFNILAFKNVKDTKANDLNFCAKFFITNNKNMVKKWIITEYEKE